MDHQLNYICYFVFDFYLLWKSILKSNRPENAEIKRYFLDCEQTIFRMDLFYFGQCEIGNDRSDGFVNAWKRAMRNERKKKHIKGRLIFRGIPTNLASNRLAFPSLCSSISPPFCLFSWFSMAQLTIGMHPIACNTRSLNYI